MRTSCLRATAGIEPDTTEMGIRQLRRYAILRLDFSILRPYEPYSFEISCVYSRRKEIEEIE